MKIALIGYGGHAREVSAQMGKTVTFFIDDEYINEDTPTICEPLSEYDPSEYETMICIADPIEREKMCKRLEKEFGHIAYFTYIHPTALIMDYNINIGEGSFIGAYSILTTNINIGKHAILNRGNHIGHDCEIGDFFSAMPNAVVGGNVKIGNSVYLGSASNIREKITIIDRTIVGINAGVVKNILHRGTYIGTPAKLLK